MDKYLVHKGVLLPSISSLSARPAKQPANTQMKQEKGRKLFTSWLASKNFVLLHPTSSRSG